MLRLQVLPEDLPAQLDAPALAGRATGGASSVGSLGDLQPLGVAAVTEQLRADVAERRSGEAHRPTALLQLCLGLTWRQM